MQPDTCHPLGENEILNAENKAYPLFEGTLYGDKILTAKFSKRISCAIKHLPLRLRMHYIHDTSVAIAHGIRKDPTFILDGKIVFEGLCASETIMAYFEKLLNRKK